MLYVQSRNTVCNRQDCLVVNQMFQVYNDCTAYLMHWSARENKIRHILVLKDCKFHAAFGYMYSTPKITFIKKVIYNALRKCHTVPGSLQYIM
jgi:hypothetical protein